MRNATTVREPGWSQCWGTEVQDSVYLMPGALYIGNQATELKTLLGSCVAVTLWHPKHQVMAMTHIVLPGSGKSNEDANPKFATSAIHLMTQTISQAGFKPRDFQLGIYGGGRMFGNDESPKVLDIGKTNVTKTMNLLKDAGYRIEQQDVLGRVYRHVLLNRLTGEVKVRQTPVSATMT